MMKKGNDVSIPDAYTFKESVELVDQDGRAGHPQCLVVSEKQVRCILLILTTIGL